MQDKPAKRCADNVEGNGKIIEQEVDRLACEKDFTPDCTQIGTLGGSPRLAALSFSDFGKFLHTIANFFTRQAQLIKLLQIEPKFRTGAEPMPEPQRGIGRNRSLTVNDTSDSIHRNAALIQRRKFGAPSTCAQNRRRRHLLTPCAVAAPSR